MYLLAAGSVRRVPSVRCYQYFLFSPFLDVPDECINMKISIKIQQCSTYVHICVSDSLSSRKNFNTCIKSCIIAITDAAHFPLLHA